LSDLQNSVSLVLKNALRLLTPDFGVRLLAPVDTTKIIYKSIMHTNFSIFPI